MDNGYTNKSATATQLPATHIPVTNFMTKKKSKIEIKKMTKKCANQLGYVYIKNDVKMYEKQNWN